MYKAMKFTSLWVMKYPKCIMEKKIFWVSFESDLQMVINQRPRLSPSLHTQYTNIAHFKASFHNLSIHEKKDATGTWHKLPYLVAEDDIMWLIRKWSSKWITPLDAGTRTSKIIEGETRKIVAMKVAEKDKEKEAHKVSTNEMEV